MLSKYLFDEEISLENPYSDVSKNDWFYKAVLKMTEKGFLTGYGDNTFRPYNYVTRAETVTVINRMLNLEKSTENKISFNDVTVLHWAYDDIMTAANIKQ